MACGTTCESHLSFSQQPRHRSTDDPFLSCDKGFPQNCDPGREISEMTKVLKDHGRTDLLNELNQVRKALIFTCT